MFNLLFTLPDSQITYNIYDRTKDEIEILLDPTKESHTNIILNDTNMRPAEATDLKSRICELNQLENFIGKTHNLKTHLDGLLTNQTETKGMMRHSATTPTSTVQPDGEIQVRYTL